MLTETLIPLFIPSLHDPCSQPILYRQKTRKSFFGESNLDKKKAIKMLTLGVPPMKRAQPDNPTGKPTCDNMQSHAQGS